VHGEVELETLMNTLKKEIAERSLTSYFSTKAEHEEKNCCQ